MLDSIFGIIDKFVPDTTTRDQLKGEIRKQEHELKLAEYDLAKSQNEVNKEQAKNPSLFVSGARPFCIWAFMIMIFYHGFIRFLIFDVGSFFGSNATFTPADTVVWTGMLSGLLGLITVRGAEKIKGVARERL